MNHRRIAALIFAIMMVMLAAVLAQQQQTPPPAAALTAKLNYLKENAARQHPDPAPTDFSQSEINAYLAAGAVKLPVGVESLTIALHAQQIIGTANVDFDKVRAGHSDNNPFLSIFTGAHLVSVDAFAEGANGQALIRINSASIDGLVLPRFALELFINKYITPKYPDVGMETRFPLPERISTATVSEGKLTLIQR